MTVRTLGLVGRAGVIIGAVALAASLLWKTFWSTPIGTIDAPRTGTTVAGCYLAMGRVAPRTVWRPLWLISAESGSTWRPVAKVVPSHGTWQQKVCIDDMAARQSRLALVVVDRLVDAEFEDIKRHGSDEVIPDWLTSNRSTTQQGGLGHRLGFFPIPDGAKPLAGVEVVLKPRSPDLFPGL